MMNGGDLPEDLMMDILLRLPVKSLKRFKCVCESWRSLFENSTFITKHLNHDKRDDSLFLRYCSRYIIDDLNKIYSYSLLSYETLDVIKNIDFGGRYLNIVASCDGIICLEAQGDIYLWNPATTQSKKLMQDPITNRGGLGSSNSWRSNHYDGFTYGFGYDKKGNDYKVVKLPRFSNTHSSAYCCAHIYELRSNSWRICNAPLPPNAAIYNKDDARRRVYTNDDVRRVYTNGIYSWLVNDKYYGNDRFLVSFDMSKEIFITTELPDQYKESTFGEILVAWNKRVVLFSFNLSGCEAEMLMLNRYGVRESWTKLYTMRSGVAFDLYYSMNFRKNGDILATCLGKVVVLNPKTQEIIKVPQLDLLQVKLPCIWVYKESLIPVN